MNPRPTIFILLCLLAGCGPAVAPRSLSELEGIVESQGAKRAQAAAEESWAEALRYLRLAREALDDRDAAQADRFAELGIIHAKIAMATARQVNAGERLEQARESKHEIGRELERVQSALAALERELERERIREHLVQTVDEVRRQAAADEELREQALDESARKQLKGARAEVARELVGRAVVGLAVLRALVSAGALTEERLLPTSGSIEAARSELARGDIAAVQGHVEAAGVETRRVWDELWQAAGENALDRAREDLVGALAKVDLTGVNEELGLGVRLGTAAGGGLSKQGRAAVAALAETIAPLVESGAVRVLVIAADRLDPLAKKTSSPSSDKRADAAAAALIEAGLEAAAIARLGCGPATPIAALQRGKGHRVAVLLVPVPGVR